MCSILCPSFGIYDGAYQMPKSDWIVEEAYVPLLEPLQTTTSFKGLIELSRWRFVAGVNIYLVDVPGTSSLRCANSYIATCYDVVLIETQGLIKVRSRMCALARKSAMRPSLLAWAMQPITRDTSLSLERSIPNRFMCH
jgi:hypothetical protein